MEKTTLMSEMQGSMEDQSNQETKIKTNLMLKKKTIEWERMDKGRMRIRESGRLENLEPGARTEIISLIALLLG